MCSKKCLSSRSQRRGLQCAQLASSYAFNITEPRSGILPGAPHLPTFQQVCRSVPARIRQPLIPNMQEPPRGSPRISPAPSSIVSTVIANASGDGDGVTQLLQVRLCTDRQYGSTMLVPWMISPHRAVIRSAEIVDLSPCRPHCPSANSMQCTLSAYWRCCMSQYPQLLLPQ